ncbi:hypothetical protein ACFWP0_09335 [Achromobacter sp. NPDC058515]|uniref:hypothetical protein n=1 Tax=Achromobacter sp. NPDC058515 TaxID=3346533 RepID=UPI00364E3867
MRSDRELLELAAKAAGMNLGRYLDGWNWSNDGPRGAGIYKIDPSQSPVGNPRFRFIFWNPLTDDGDALRLAVKLNLTTVFHPALGQALCRPYWSTDMGKESREDVEKHANDPYAATRRAIVRAAAEIGAHPKQHNDGGADA